jgi:hypothetical protein
MSIRKNCKEKTLWKPVEETKHCKNRRQPCIPMSHKFQSFFATTQPFQMIYSSLESWQRTESFRLFKFSKITQ